MERVWAILSHPALAVLAGGYLMGVSFARTFFGVEPGPVVTGSLLWIGGGMVAVTVRNVMERSGKT
ncbi:hypothetical protein [Roseobacter sp. HKCCA0434]|uniref:hypothetical protein n=1 Tax=Roseobacter sp. HKCCA0434 TaxID=3079297 RepID=UPI002905EDF3|nr:hypothetical protein [Roseobacter sp. HKCCA0434]